MANNKRSSIIIPAGLILAFIFLLKRSRGAAIVPAGKVVVPNLALQGLNPNLQKFLQLITRAEGTDLQGTPYNELYGFSNFTDFSRHPNKKVTKNGITSTAAGRYQILYKTYQDLGLKDFSPKSQDYGAIKLIADHGALPDVLAGAWPDAIYKVRKVWASLPGANYPGQKSISLTRAIDYINSL